MKGVAIVSGGKDSIYSFYLMKMYGFEIPYWITFVPKNKESFMLHTLNLSAVKKQAELSGVKHLMYVIEGEKEKEVKEMEDILSVLKEDIGFEFIVSGAIRSEYQKHRIDMIAEKLGIPSYSPLWHKNSKKVLKEMTDFGFEFLIVYGSEDFQNWVGKKISKENIEKFVEFLKEIGSDIAGEGGEFETFVVKTPFWEREIKVEGKIEKDLNSYRFEIKDVR